LAHKRDSGRLANQTTTGLSFQEYRNIMKIRSDRNISQDHRNRNQCGSSQIQFLRNRLIFPGQVYIFSPNYYPQSNFNSKAQSDQKLKNNLFENESMNNEKVSKKEQI